MKTLFCAVVGLGDVFFVEIQNYWSVAHLKVAIKKAIWRSCSPHKLTLYAARTGRHWLKNSDRAYWSLVQGSTSADLETILSSANEMDPVWRLDSANLDFPQASENELHVLVEIPSQGILKPSCPSWLEELGWIVAGVCCWWMVAIIIGGVISTAITVYR
ncbi:hypothetical protein PC116_g7067 [Phytophthora cactorum]|uniref:Crinkler effector protein N-terminal domain-containing protein n=1 Tax=Phytophthora cactorum TaxID=29920 RepID=A0A8T1E033_9STRA|nr:hypothetical protein Pcac1_g24235 [Phytophthora cactorum]KAG2831142.1 hypothetical protein PC112_g7408 [Phytophthora cactorum]KAG2831210.1 hypothetical protein PC111_g7088 [Phytophthora cactorum]KAG2859589.1 hypothetical protein PC113_g8809 [Phytophthora cactorum]KAG2912195.1 hypothetical protein PC114_g9005 [Phytophthora cactorum]